MRQTEITVYPGMRHELVNEIGREKVEEDVLSWVLSHAERRE